MDAKKIKYLTTTAILLALTVVFQLLGNMLLAGSPVAPYIIGALVNLCFIIAAVAVGLWSGVTLAVLSPVLALLLGIMKMPQMLPWTMLGNLALVLLYALLCRGVSDSIQSGWKRWLAVGVGAAIAKYALMVLGQAVTLTAVKGQPFSAAISAAFALQAQQIVTALVAMVIAKPVIAALPKQLKQ